MDEIIRRPIANLEIAEKALHRNLRVHSIDENAQAHIREAIIATDAAGNGRSVDHLVHDPDGMERLLKFLLS